MPSGQRGPRGQRGSSVAGQTAPLPSKPAGMKEFSCEAASLCRLIPSQKASQSEGGQNARALPTCATEATYTHLHIYTARSGEPLCFVCCSHDVAGRRSVFSTEVARCLACFSITSKSLLLLAQVHVTEGETCYAAVLPELHSFWCRSGEASLQRRVELS